MSFSDVIVRRDFPALRERSEGTVPVYLDSACMSLVPQAVLGAMEEYYRDFPGCAGRSLHRFAEEVSHRYERSRELCSEFLSLGDPRGIVFLRNATEALNLVGQGLPWKRGDRVLISDQEHNSNLVLWQRLAAERGIRIDVLALPESGFDLEQLRGQLHRSTRLVSLFHTSNLDGRSLPIREIAEVVHDHGAQLLVDGCQAAPHLPVDLRELRVDYYAVSAHKMMGPTGVGFLAAPFEQLSGLRPLLTGGETVEWSTLTQHALRPPPHRFEAGLQNYAGVLGTGAAIEYLGRIGRDQITAHDRALNARVSRGLADQPRVHVLGPSAPADRPSVYAFALDGVDPADAALFLDAGHHVMVRSGRHCVHSWYEARGLEGNVRASFYAYNTEADADALVNGVTELLERVPESAPKATARRTMAAPARARPQRKR
ncbi:MAG: aminotransferase class V-fold PLP-dependent enzyme [Thermoplasmata archaeon]|nr:aminotransferase class V-fold PLP-dependent enzyme [Thermoplasmata archaeon]